MNMYVHVQACKHKPDQLKWLLGKLNKHLQ